MQEKVITFIERSAEFESLCGKFSDTLFVALSAMALYLLEKSKFKYVDIDNFAFSGKQEIDFGYSNREATEKILNHLAGVYNHLLKGHSQIIFSSFFHWISSHLDFYTYK